jgi:hypothetical protein
MKRDEKLLCPSYKCVSGARLIGILQGSGSVAFLGSPLPVDRRFVENAAQGRPAELRFRFAGACAQCRCANWQNHSCGVAAKLAPVEADAAVELPNCGIRPRCRWFAERGAAACAVCPEIVRGVSWEEP